MSPSFEVGEIAIFINTESPRYLEECCVVQPLQDGRIIDDASMTWRQTVFYRVTFRGADTLYAAEPHHLRKKPPKVEPPPPNATPEPLGSWDAIKRIVDWTPADVPVAA